jgi:polyferredoxin
MKRIQIKKDDIKEYLKQRKERNQQRMEERKNSPFAKKMEPIYFWMNRLSLLLHFLWAVVLNFVIESISRHSVVPAWEYLTTSPWAFLFNTYMIFITFLLVYLIRRRVFLRIIIYAFRFEPRLDIVSP